ncbi:MAG: hypothetical protein ACFB16_02720 [Phormidesmis sp.]
MSQTITVKCPQCQQVYINWHVPAVGKQTKKQGQNGQSLDTYRPSTSCSQCGYRSMLDELVEQDGVFQQVSETR